MILASPLSILFILGVLSPSVLVPSLSFPMKMRRSLPSFEPGLIKIALFSGWFYPTSLGILMMGSLRSRERTPCTFSKLRGWVKRLLPFLVVLKSHTLTMGRREQVTFVSSMKVCFIFMELFSPLKANIFPL